MHLTRSTLEGFAEHDELDLVVDGQYTGTGNTTEDVSTSSLEEGLHTLSGNDGPEGMEGRVIFDGLTTVQMIRNCSSIFLGGLRGTYEVIIIRRRTVSRG